MTQEPAESHADTIWASDPASNWTRLIPAELWPALVMKELDNPAPVRLAAFRGSHRRVRWGWTDCPKDCRRTAEGA